MTILPILALVGLGALIFSGSGNKPKPAPEPDVEPKKDKASPPPSPSTDVSCVDTNIADVDWVQRRLTRHGFPVSDDGACGPKTKGAIGAFQASVGLPKTGYADEATISALEAAPADPGGAGDTGGGGGGLGTSGFIGLTDELIAEAEDAATKDAQATIAELDKNIAGRAGTQTVIMTEFDAVDPHNNYAENLANGWADTYWSKFKAVIADNGLEVYPTAMGKPYISDPDMQMLEDEFLFGGK